LVCPFLSIYPLPFRARASPPKSDPTPPYSTHFLPCAHLRYNGQAWSSFFGFRNASVPPNESLFPQSFRQLLETLGTPLAISLIGIRIYERADMLFCSFTIASTVTAPRRTFWSATRTVFLRSCFPLAVLFRLQTSPSPGNSLEFFQLFFLCLPAASSVPLESVRTLSFFLAAVPDFLS